MITTDDLVEYGDRDIVTEIERLTRQVSGSYVSMLSNPARLIEQLIREEIPPKPPSDDAWFRDFVASTEGLNDDGDDSQEKETSSSTPGQRPNFPPPLSVHNYLSLCHGYIDELKTSIITRLQSGELEAFGLQSGDQVPTKIERGRWFDIRLDWGKSAATDKSGNTYYDLAIRRAGLAPPQAIPDDVFDQGASTAPYVAKFDEWVEQRKVPPTISSDTERRLRSWGAAQAPPLPLPKFGSIRRAIVRDK